MQASTNARQLVWKNVSQAVQSQHHVHTYSSLACSNASTSEHFIPRLAASNGHRNRATSRLRHASTLPSNITEIPIPVIKNTAGDKGKGRAGPDTRPFLLKRGPSKRELPIRKQFLFQQYKHIFNTCPVLVFLKPEDFTVEEITRLRVDLSLIKPASSVSKASSKTSKSSPTAEAINTASSEPDIPRFLFLRAGLMPALLQSMPDLPSQAVLSHLETHGRTLAVLTLPTLDPPALKAALKAISKLSKSPNVRKIQAEASAKLAAKAAGGNKSKAAAPAPSSADKAAEASKKEERLSVISAIVENRAMDAQAISKIADLPSLDQILAQLVGLVETPARQIISLTGRAGGEDLVRTLEGFKIGLEEKEKGPAGDVAAGADGSAANTTA